MVKINGNSDNGFVRERTRMREVDGVKQEVTIKFGKDGKKSYFVDGKQVYIDKNPLFGKKTFTTEKPPVAFQSLETGARGQFNLEGIGNVTGTVGEDENGKKYIESRQESDTGARMIARYAERADGSLGCSYRQLLRPDGGGIEIIYDEYGEIAQKNIIKPNTANIPEGTRPDAEIAEGTPNSSPESESNSQLSGYPNLLGEVEVTGKKPAPEGLPDELLAQREPEIRPEFMTYNGGTRPDVEIAEGTPNSSPESESNSQLDGYHNLLDEVVVTAPRLDKKPEGLPDELLAQRNPEIRHENNIFEA